MRVEEIDGKSFEDLARRVDVALPIEQAPVWDAFDHAVQGRHPWRRLVVLDPHPVALISFTKMRGRGFDYLWAKHGPVWFTPPTAANELDLRAGLAEYVRQVDPSIVFLRLHAVHEAPDLHELLQTVTYDRTVRIDLSISEEERFSQLSKSTRKKLRRALEVPHVVITEESSAGAQDFSEYFAILEETAQRDGFGVHHAQVYAQMLAALRPHVRLYVARLTDDQPDKGLAPNRAVSWIICTVFDGHGVNYYSGQTAEGRTINIGVRLRWHIFNDLANQGVNSYDLMGVDSPRAPQLIGVGAFKRQFGPEVSVAGAWDFPIRPRRYWIIRVLLRAKRLLIR